MRKVSVWFIFFSILGPRVGVGGRDYLNIVEEILFELFGHNLCYVLSTDEIGVLNVRRWLGDGSKIFAKNRLFSKNRISFAEKHFPSRNRLWRLFEKVIPAENVKTR